MRFSKFEQRYQGTIRGANGTRPVGMVISCYKMSASSYAAIGGDAIGVDVSVLTSPFSRMVGH